MNMTPIGCRWRHSRIRSFARAAVLLLPALVASPAAATAQNCSYAECALRVRAAGFTSPPAIVRGHADSVVVMLTSFGTRVAPFFQQSDSAYYHGLRYDTYSRRATVLNIAGPVAFIVGSMLTNWRQKPVASSLMMGGALGITMWGGYNSNLASDELSRAVWWYNRQLVEQGYPPAPVQSSGN